MILKSSLEKKIIYTQQNQFNAGITNQIQQWNRFWKIFHLLSRLFKSTKSRNLTINQLFYLIANWLKHLYCVRTLYHRVKFVDFHVRFRFQFIDWNKQTTTGHNKGASDRGSSLRCITGIYFWRNSNYKVSLEVVVKVIFELFYLAESEMQKAWFYLMPNFFLYFSCILLNLLMMGNVMLGNVMLCFHSEKENAKAFCGRICFWCPNYNVLKIYLKCHWWLP